MRWGAASLLLVCACNQVFGIEPVVQTTVDANLMDADLRADIDADGLADVVDPCIAGPIDELLDLDFDDIPSGVDACPFDANVADGDQDGLAASCDLFPALAGDRRRCVMSFRDYDLNPLLWQPRPGQPGWDVRAMTHRAASVGTIVAVTALEGAVTTSVQVYGLVGATANGGTFRLIVRGSPFTPLTDTGCEITRRTASYELGLLPPGPVATLDAQGQYFLLTATLVPGPTPGPNLRCTLHNLEGGIASIVEKVELPGGRVALSATNIDLTLFGLGVYERDDAPP